MKMKKKPLKIMFPSYEQVACKILSLLNKKIGL